MWKGVPEWPPFTRHVCFPSQTTTSSFLFTINFEKSELKDVGKPELALEVLHDIITSRRHRSWTKVHEQIMIEYINLCIDMRKVCPTWSVVLS